MKKLPLYLILMFLFDLCFAQLQHTNYGTGSGSQGNYSSFFGYYAGRLATSSASYNTFIGSHSGYQNTSGDFNVGVGRYTLYNLTSGHQNTALGYGSLYLHNGNFNTAVGYFSLRQNTDGSNNTVIGNYAGFTNKVGSNIVAIGYHALRNNTADANTAVGAEALYSNTSGHANVALGYEALRQNTTSTDNTGIGHLALRNNTASYNTGIGSLALYSNTSGNKNIAIGTEALLNNSNGERNTAIGHEALEGNQSGYGNVSIGMRTMFYGTIGNYNTAIGTYAMNKQNITNSSSLTCIGAYSGPISGISGIVNSTAIKSTITASNQVRIGNSLITSIGGYANWTNVSDKRFKNEINEDIVGLNFVNQLKPVSYILDRSKIDDFLGIPDSVRTPYPEAKRQVGFVAQDVEKIIKDNGYVFSGVDAPENEHSHYGIRYAEFVVPLVKAVQELSARLEEQQVLIEELQSKNDLKTEDEIQLYQNQPNPFNLDTEIKLNLSRSVVNAQVMVYNLEGKQLKSIEVHDRGSTSITIQGSEFAAGMYIYTLIADGKMVSSKKMILTK